MIGVVVEDATSSAAIVPSTPWPGLALIALTLLCLPTVTTSVLPAGANEERPRVDWKLAHIVFVVLAMFAAAQVTGHFVRFRQEVTPAGDGSDIALPDQAEGIGLLYASAAVLGVGALVALALAFRAGPGDLRALGVRSGRVFSAPLRAIAAYALCLPGVLGIGLVWAWTLGQFGVTEIEQPLVTMFSGLAPDERLIPVIVGTLAIPLCEEILFRGFLQSFAVQKLGVSAGIVLTSILFGLLHGPVVCVPIFALSCLLGFVRVRTQRLHAAWAVHALHNGLQFALLYVDWEAVKYVAPGTLAALGGGR